MKPTNGDLRLAEPSWRVFVEGLIRVLEQKDPYTRGHSRDVQHLAVQLARALRWHRQKVMRVSISALLHDIGKVVVERATLNNHGTHLTPVERDQLIDHPYDGAQIIRGIFPVEVLYGVLQHHEDWNGSGYPFGLRGEEIHPFGRLIKIADAYCTMVSKRAYKDPLPHEVAVQRITEGAGVTFDPRMVDVFVKQVAPTLHRQRSGRSKLV